ncbi:MAG: carbohydrate ABC transporter permease [Spirochaetales bacterium]|nr:carbohydrate ABC transporter permease [Spirochaetia bacterium]MDD7459824.1 carbohydrate ABC transporter permease [Spirochaetales bacterium]
MKSDKATLTFQRSIIYALMVVFTLIAVVPIYLMLINATRSNAQINAGLSFLPGGNTMANWRNLTSRDFKIWQGFGNSAFISVCSTVLGVYFSTLTAYAIHVFRFKGRNFLWGFILVVIMIPGTLSFIGFYQFMAKCNLTNSFIPLIVPTIASAGTVLFIKQYMESILSFELIDAGRIDGAGEFMIFNVVILPIMIPALAAQCIFSFVGSWNNFMTPFVLLSDQKKYTLPMLVQTLRGDIYRTEYGSIYLGVAVSLIPILIFYACMSRYIISGITMGSVKE